MASTPKSVNAKKASTPKWRQRQKGVTPKWRRRQKGVTPFWRKTTRPFHFHTRGILKKNYFKKGKV